MQTATYSSLKVNQNGSDKRMDTLVIEAPLQININNEPYTVVMRTPSNDNALIRGLLFAEDIYRSKQPLAMTLVSETETFSSIINCSIPVHLLGKGYLNKRTLLSVSSCGICGKKSLEDIEITGTALENTTQISQQKIEQMQAQMQVAQLAFKKTGGSHAAAIFNTQQQLLTCKEDIGRHNAVDKCIGDLLSHNQLNQAHSLFVSGRVSYEIVSKAFFAKIPILIAISACSSLAVDYANEFGLCLIGFSRNNTMTIYTHPKRLKTS